MRKIIALGVLAAVCYLIASGTAAAFWSGFWPALHNGAQFHAGTSFGKHYTAAQQKSYVIDFAWVLGITGVIVWGFFGMFGRRSRRSRTR